MSETYLGDGLYASLDEQAQMIVLRAPRSGGDHWVGLEPEIFLALLKFASTSGWGELIRRMEARDENEHF